MTGVQNQDKIKISFHCVTWWILLFFVLDYISVWLLLFFHRTIEGGKYQINVKQSSDWIWEASADILFMTFNWVDQTFLRLYISQVSAISSPFYSYITSNIFLMMFLENIEGVFFISLFNGSCLNISLLPLTITHLYEKWF